MDTLLQLLLLFKTTERLDGEIDGRMNDQQSRIHLNMGELALIKSEIIIA